MLCCGFKLLLPTFVNVFTLCLPSGSVSSCDAFLNVFQSHGLKPEVICPCATSPEALTVAIRRYNVNHTSKEINRETCAFHTYRDKFVHLCKNKMYTVKFNRDVLY